MLNIITKREASDEEGFTLIELVIVVAILGILLAIGIPAYGAIQYTSEAHAMKNNSKALYDEYKAEFVQRGGSQAYTPATHDLIREIVYKVTDKWDAEHGYDYRWGMSPTIGAAFYGDVNVCFYTYKNDGREDGFGRGYGDTEAGCEDVG